MTSTSLQKLWMKDLPLPVIKLAKRKATVALSAWNDTVAGILTAAKAVHEVREAIGGKGGQGTNAGSFGAWAKEELDRSSSTASCLAVIGARHKELFSMLKSLPPEWYTLYELAKSPDDVFRRALRRVNPDMGRNEMTCLIAEETEQPRPKKATRIETTRALPSERWESRPEPVPREAANTTIMAGSVWRTVKDLEQRVGVALMSGSLSPEAKAFMIHNYLRPSIDLITAMENRLAEP